MIPSEGIPLLEVPSGGTPLLEVPSGRTPLLEVPSGGTPLLEVPSRGTPLLEVPSEGTPLLEVPSEGTPLLAVPLGKFGVTTTPPSNRTPGASCCCSEAAGVACGRAGANDDPSCPGMTKGPAASLGDPTEGCCSAVSGVHTLPSWPADVWNLALSVDVGNAGVPVLDGVVWMVKVGVSL